MSAANSPSPAPAPKLTVLQTLNARNAEIASLKAENARLSNPNAAAVTSSKMPGNMPEVGTDQASLRAKWESLAGAEKTAFFRQHEAVLIGRQTAAASDDPATTFATWQGLEGAQKTAFFRKHKALLLAHQQAA